MFDRHKSPTRKSSFRMIGLAPSSELTCNTIWADNLNVASLRMADPNADINVLELFKVVFV